MAVVGEVDQRNEAESLLCWPSFCWQSEPAASV